MIKRPTLKLSKVKNSLFAVPRWMGENVFFGFLILFFLALLISSFIFYKYVFSARNVQLDLDIMQTNFQEQTLQEVLEIWEDRAAGFDAAGKGTPRDIFAPSQ